MAYRFLRPAAVSATASFDPIWIISNAATGCEARNNRAAEGVKIARNLAVSSRTSWHKKRRRRLEALDRVGPGWAVR